MSFQWWYSSIKYCILIEACESVLWVSSCCSLDVEMTRLSCNQYPISPGARRSVLQWRWERYGSPSQPSMELVVLGDGGLDDNGERRGASSHYPRSNKIASQYVQYSTVFALHFIYWTTPRASNTPTPESRSQPGPDYIWTLGTIVASSHQKCVYAPEAPPVHPKSSAKWETHQFHPGHPIPQGALGGAKPGNLALWARHSGAHV